MKRMLGFSAALMGAGALSYGAYAALTWRGYGHTQPLAEVDPLAERFMHSYDVRHELRLRIHAPAQTAMEAIHNVRLSESFAIRSLFKLREAIMRAYPAEDRSEEDFLTFVRSLGWEPLAEIPERALVFGAATQPWIGNVKFRGIPASEFAAFEEPGYVKILWTLRVDPVNANECIVGTETRARATDERSRKNFRPYWAAFFPGIVLVRLAALSLVRMEAQRLKLTTA